MILSTLQDWSTKQVNFVLAFPQADITHDNYMKLPAGIKTVHGNGNTHMLKIKENLYGGKNTVKIWYDYLKGALENIGFKQSKVDSCVFYCKGVTFMFYADDGIFFAKNDNDINKAINDLRYVKKEKCKLNLDDQGE